MNESRIYCMMKLMFPDDTEWNFESSYYVKSNSVEQLLSKMFSQLEEYMDCIMRFVRKKEGKILIEIWGYKGDDLPIIKLAGKNKEIIYKLNANIEFDFMGCNVKYPPMTAGFWIEGPEEAIYLLSNLIDINTEYIDITEDKGKGMLRCDALIYENYVSSKGRKLWRYKNDTSKRIFPEDALEIALKPLEKNIMNIKNIMESNNCTLNVFLGFRHKDFLPGFWMGDNIETMRILNANFSVDVNEMA